MGFVGNCCFLLATFTLTLLPAVKCAAFQNCNETSPILMIFSLPDPLLIKLGGFFNMTAGSVVRQTTPMMFKVQHTMWKKILDTWWKIPCFGPAGSCTFEMPCQDFIDMGYNGTCPIPEGVYTGYHLSIPIPHFDVPTWLTDGYYKMHIEGYDDDLKTLWFCGDIIQLIKQVPSDRPQVQLQRMTDAGDEIVTVADPA